MKRKTSNFLRFLSYIKPYGWAIILAAIGGVVKFTLPLIVPQLTRHLIDDIFPSARLDGPAKIRALLFTTGSAILLFLFVWAPFTYIRHYFAGLAGNRSVFDLRCDLYHHVLRMSASFFNRQRSGNVVSRLIQDVAQAQNMVGNALTNIWIDGAAVIAILYFLFTIDVFMTWVALANFPLYLFFFRFLGSRIKENSHAVQQGIETMSGVVQERVAGNVIIRAFTGEEREQRAFLELSDGLLGTTMKSVHLQSLNMMISGVLTNIAPLVVMIVGGLRVIRGELTVGELVAITMYLNPLYLPLQRFSELNAVFSTSMAAIDRIFELMDMKPEIKDGIGARDIGNIKGTVAFHDVSFGYHPGHSILKHITFSVNAGQHVAIVGRSGSGKSTIVNLIPRFYDPSSGSITIDGIDIRDFTLRSLRRHIGMVLQDPILFSGTIRENLLYGKPEAKKEELLTALREANAYDFVMQLPRGLDTEVGERGLLLSGGQKQRLTIARAFLKDPVILILDEATSALDSESEALIQESLQRLMKNRTTFIIAHRLSTIKNADLILVLDQGGIVEQGTHEELLEQGTVYRNLYARQFSAVSLT
ncbi:MAG: ABC transporter ATP-binding protein/permease [Treponemataceae bacterium]|nr:ABC transporter ATP-binding protein/permease [Treponemataceae bacterium]